MLKNFTKILIIVAVFILLPTPSFAQLDINIPSALSSELNIDIIPTYPRPSETVFLSLSLYTDDLSSADIAWYRDGKLELQGKNKIKYSFKNGPSGKETKIEVRIKLVSGVVFSRKLSITPANIDLMWESNSYVPPFYKGKALHAQQGVLKIVAVPEFIKNGKAVPPENLVYEWSNETEVYQNQSGYGKNVLLLSGSILGREENIDVLVTDPVSGMVAQAFVQIAPVKPEISFYKNDPYYGYIFDTALPNFFDLKGEEIAMIAAPYYMSKEREGSLVYNWRLNGKSVPELNDSMTAVFRKPEDKSGESYLSLRIENMNRILQQGEASLVFQFDN